MEKKIKNLLFKKKKNNSFHDLINKEEKKLLLIKNFKIEDMFKSQVQINGEKKKVTYNTQDFFPKEKSKTLPKLISTPLNSKRESKENEKIKVNIMSLIQNKNHPISLEVLKDNEQLEIKNLKIKANNIIKGISFFSRKGVVRAYNEDKITVLYNISKPENKYTDKWPFCCFFGIYDGHNGTQCAEYLKDNLHNLVKKNFYINIFR